MAAVPEPPEAVAQDSSIHVGDSLEIFVQEDPSFNGTFVVRERGDIIIPALGRIDVSGLTVSAAEKRIKGILEEGQLREATVILDRVRKANSATGPGPIAGGTQILVYLTGKVNQPGQHVLTLPDGEPIGVYEAILIMGGMTRFADEQKVHILRADENNIRQKLPVNIRLIQMGKAPDPVIGQGDIVVVPEKVFGF